MLKNYRNELVEDKSKILKIFKRKISTFDLQSQEEVLRLYEKIKNIGAYYWAFQMRKSVIYSNFLISSLLKAIYSIHN